MHQSIAKHPVDSGLFCFFGVCHIFIIGIAYCLIDVCQVIGPSWTLRTSLDISIMFKPSTGTDKLRVRCR
jgi:hypothetical protein